MTIIPRFSTAENALNVNNRSDNRRPTLSTIEGGNVVAWNKAIPIVATVVPWTVSVPREAIRHIRETERTIANYHSAIATQKKYAKRYVSQIRKAFKTAPPTQKEALAWVKSHVPSVTGLFFIEGGMVVDFTACESRFNPGRGEADNLRLGRDERLILPPMRFIFSRDNAYWLNVPIIGGAPRSDVYVHPHSNGRDGTCWGNLPIHRNPDNTWNWVMTSISAIREWRKVFSADVLVRPKDCQQNIWDIFKRYPDSFNPIEGLDGNVYSTMADMLTKTPRGVASDIVYTSSGRFNEDPEDSECEGCGNHPDDCSCDTCSFCDSRDIRREGIGGIYYCHSCAHGICFDCEAMVYGACAERRTGFVCEFECGLLQSDDVCTCYRYCVTCNIPYSLDWDEVDTSEAMVTQCRSCSSSNLTVMWRTLSNVFREAYQYRTYSCPTCGSVEWDNAARVSCECPENGLFIALREHHLGVQRRQVIARLWSSISGGVVSAITRMNDYSCMRHLVSEAGACSNRVIACTCGENYTRCSQCQYIVLLNRLWSTRHQPEGRTIVNATDNPNLLV